MSRWINRDVIHFGVALERAAFHAARERRSLSHRALVS